MFFYACALCAITFGAAARGCHFICDFVSDKYMTCTRFPRAFRSSTPFDSMVAIQPDLELSFKHNRVLRNPELLLLPRLKDKCTYKTHMAHSELPIYLNEPFPSLSLPSPFPLPSRPQRPSRYSMPPVHSPKKYLNQ